MVTIHNSDLFKELRDGTKSQQLRDGVLPTQLAEKVVPVMEVNPKMFRRINIVKGATANTVAAITAYTTPTDRDFYLTGFSCSVSKDVLCDSSTASSSISCVVDKATVLLGYVACTTLTAQTIVIDKNYTIPIKIDRGTAISLGALGALTAGSITRGLAITGYTDDLPNA